MNTLRVKIGTNTFNGDGATRWPIHALVIEQTSDRHMVVKRFKVPLGQNVQALHTQERYLKQMEVQSVAAQLAREFNQRTEDLGIQNLKRREFTLVSLLNVDSKFYNMERYLPGSWIRYSNNAGYINTQEDAATLQAFTHWTHKRFGGYLMVTDLTDLVHPIHCKGWELHVFAL